MLVHFFIITNLAKHEFFFCSVYMVFVSGGLGDAVETHAETIGSLLDLLKTYVDLTDLF